jgi:hypothetical protein
MRLQGFPRSYRFWGTMSDQFRQVCDAVPPPLAFAIAKAMRVAMESKSKHGADSSHDVLWNALYSSVHIQPPQGLIGFFEAYSRKSFRRFPWRTKRATAFQLLVAEVLLKQTKAEDVAALWPELIARFPTVTSLAKANETQLAEWLEPLGSQRQRAASLINMSRVLISEFGGEVPTQIEALLTIPGVGLYSAAAICCFKSPGAAARSYFWRDRRARLANLHRVASEP